MEGSAARPKESECCPRGEIERYAHSATNCAGNARDDEKAVSPEEEAGCRFVCSLREIIQDGKENDDHEEQRKREDACGVQHRNRRDQRCAREVGYEHRAPRPAAR